VKTLKTMKESERKKPFEKLGKGRFSEIAFKAMGPLGLRGLLGSKENCRSLGWGEMNHIPAKKDRKSIDKGGEPTNFG